MAGFIQTIAGMSDMTEQVIATDFLISAKAAVQNYAIVVIC
jgi:similar to spore coat protein